MNGDHIGVVHNTLATMNPILRGEGEGRGRWEGGGGGGRVYMQMGERQFGEVSYHHRDFKFIIQV